MSASRAGPSARRAAFVDGGSRSQTFEPTIERMNRSAASAGEPPVRATSTA